MTIKLSISIDGLPLAKSSKTQFWLILLSFVKLSFFLSKIFPIGIYHSFKGKPGDVNEFFRPFLTEIQNLLSQGIKITEKKYIFKLLTL